MTTRDQATGKSERLAVLNSAEQEALVFLISMIHSGWSFWRWMNPNWLWPVVVRALLQIVGGDKLIIPFADGAAHEPIQRPAFSA
jgi:hypothetical protein